MKTETIIAAVELSNRIGNVILATVGPERVPHIAMAGPLLFENNFVIITGWYCPVTLSNIQQFHEVSIAVWDKQTDSGYQIIGNFEKVQDIAVLDNYAPEMENIALYPQVERQLLVKVDSILFFSQTLHADTAQ